MIPYGRHSVDDDDIEIGEIEVLTDVRTTFFQNIDEISVTGPEEVTVTLYSPEQLEFELFNRLNVMWADRESLAYADFPPIDFSSFGGRMEVFDEARTHYRMALEIDPNFAKAKEGLSRVEKIGQS